MKTCGFTGHRNIRKNKLECFRNELKREIEQAVADGFTCFISGFANGADLEFAAAVIEIKKNNSEIFLEAALPYRNRMKTKNPLFHELIGVCNGVYFGNEKYKIACCLSRNYYIVKNSERIIAVFDGRKYGKTSEIISVARKMEKDIRYIFTKPVCNAKST